MSACCLAKGKQNLGKNVKDCNTGVSRPRAAQLGPAPTATLAAGPEAESRESLLCCWCRRWLYLHWGPRLRSGRRTPQACCVWAAERPGPRSCLRPGGSRGRDPPGLNLRQLLYSRPSRRPSHGCIGPAGGAGDGSTPLTKPRGSRVEGGCPLQKQHCINEGLLLRPTAHSSRRPPKEVGTAVPWTPWLEEGPTPAAAAACQVKRPLHQRRASCCAT
ncbi:hypothetical protein NDU88_009238 [Pleurodeles waltl]|uniref:Uncharacterized protein n=1 Tax=Pleurodeles waltl TaxID=8319 RepID=A0AAV7NYG5_PLEWA|nr:hypothetical protein NDU88_009238 [Pleurodeles waltl]